MSCFFFAFNLMVLVLPQKVFYRKARKVFCFVSRLANTKFAKLYHHKALRTLRLICIILNKKTFAHFAVNTHKPEQKLYQHKALRTLHLICIILNKKTFAHFAVNTHKPEQKLYQHKALRTLRLIHIILNKKKPLRTLRLIHTSQNKNFINTKLCELCV